jgi:hypothetical protein
MTQNTIKIRYQHVDGVHFFESMDRRVCGLCAASSDPKLAFEDVTHQLSVLLADEGEERAWVEPAVSFDEFWAYVTDLLEDKSRPHLRPSPAANIDWRGGVVRQRLAVG